MNLRSLLIAAAILPLVGIAYAQTGPATRKAHVIGVVFPNDARPGERASGSVVLYPGAIAGSGVHVEKASVEIDENRPRKAELSGIVIDAGVQKRTADQNFVADVPAGAKSVHLVMSRDDRQIAAVDVPIEASTSGPLLCGSSDWISGTEQDGSQSQYRTPATYCYAGMAVIAGQFNGDAQQTRIEVAGTAARIVAESQRYCYWLLPRAADPGSNRVTLHEGSHTVTFTVNVPRLDLLQLLEDQGASAAEVSPPQANAAASDKPHSSFPLGLGIGVGGFGIGGGDDSSGGDLERSVPMRH